MKVVRWFLLLALLIAFVLVFIYDFYMFKYQDVYQAGSQRFKILAYLLFVTILSIDFALLEIQIEGKHGWAQKLPTWVYKSDWIMKLLGGKYITGYHIILVFLFLPAFFHLPLFFTKWSVYKEFIVFGSYFFFLVVEDFFWFILNPAFGLKKFNSKNKKIWWHKKWFGPVPDFYLEMLLIAFTLLSIGLPYL